MNIFQKEYDDGINDLILSNSSVSYSSLAEPCFEDHLKNALNIAVASLTDYDLYHVQSILVSTVWNKNDDVFDPKETWVARHSPEHKPANLNHDEKEIVGHIISNIPVTVDGKIIPEDINPEELPSKYHILTGSVIYLAYRDIELKERALRLIDEIQSNNKYVSMECLFKGFDYALRSVNTPASDGYQVIKRDKDSAYLTKFLRKYGGSGEYNGYKIGRLLKDITFSGKGFVDKPANPDSVVFTINDLENACQDEVCANKNTLSILELEQKAEKKTDLDELCVSNIQQPNNTTENVMNENDVIEIKTALAELKTATVANQDNEIAKMQASISALEVTVSELNEKLSLNEATATDLNSRIAAGEAALEISRAETEAVKAGVEQSIADKELVINDLNGQIASLTEAVAVYKDQEVAMAKKEKLMKRTASLVENGVTHEVATSYAEKFCDVDDDMFDAMSALLKAKTTSVAAIVSETTELVSEVDESTVSSPDESILDNVEVTPEISLAVSSEVEDVAANVRSELVEFVSSKLVKSKR